MQTLTVLAVFALTGLGNAQNYRCPDGYVQLATGCYQFTRQSNIQWCQAYAICSLQLNGYLAEIETEQEQNALRSYITGVIDPSRTYDWWIGGGDMLKEGDYRWMTTGNPVTYLPWSLTHSNTTAAGNDCLGISANSDFLWNNFNCYPAFSQDKPFKAICETSLIECCYNENKCE